jgi:hypothetical protein
MGRIALDKTITDEFVNKLATQQQVYKMDTNLSYTTQKDSKDMAELAKNLNGSITDFYTKVEELANMVGAVAQNIEDRDNDLSKGWNEA